MNYASLQETDDRYKLVRLIWYKKSRMFEHAMRRSKLVNLVTVETFNW